jgi:Xaa-Pro aminopeptidase
MNRRLPLLLALLPFLPACIELQLGVTSTARLETPAPPGSEVFSAPDPATAEACTARRARAAAALENGVLVVEAGEDGHGRFHADDDYHWLTGAAVPGSALVVVAQDGRVAAEVLYLPRKDARHELWNGPRLAPGEAATAKTGVADTRPLARYVEELPELVPAGAMVFATGAAVEEWLATSNRNARPANALLAPLQAVREPAELVAQRAAIDITQAALVDAFRVAVPGAYEFTAEAAVESGFRRRGAEALAFPSICGAGANGCVLHYRANAERLEAGELLLMDVGAKFRGYCADVTRTIPVGGRFTDRQREVYTHVYRASELAAAELKPGSSLSAAQAVAVAYFAEHGFTRRDFPHSIGHGLGLLVHDAPGRGQKLEPGMVVTIEPGLYLRDEAIGIRIEDDYLITEDGAERLTTAIPTEPAALERFLADIRAAKPSTR